MYTLVLDLGIVVKNSDGAIVSPCQSAEDSLFVEYQAWANSGNSPLMISKEDLLTPEYSYANVNINYVPEVVVFSPDSVTAVQIRLALNSMGIRDNVESEITSSNNRDLQDLWEYSTTIRKDNVHVIQMAQNLSLNIDEVFSLAATF